MFLNVKYLNYILIFISFLKWHINWKKKIILLFLSWTLDSDWTLPCLFSVSTMIFLWYLIFNTTAVKNPALQRYGIIERNVAHTNVETEPPWTCIMQCLTDVGYVTVYLRYIKHPVVSLGISSGSLEHLAA